MFSDLSTGRKNFKKAGGKESNLWGQKLEYIGPPEPFLFFFAFWNIQSHSGIQVSLPNLLNVHLCVLETKTNKQIGVSIFCRSHKSKEKRVKGSARQSVWFSQDLQCLQHNFFHCRHQHSRAVSTECTFFICGQTKKKNWRKQKQKNWETFGVLQKFSFCDQWRIQSRRESIKPFHNSVLAQKQSRFSDLL